MVVSALAQPAFAGPYSPPTREEPAPIPPPPLPAWVIEATRSAGSGQSQLFFDVEGSRPTLHVNAPGSSAPRSDRATTAPLSSNMQVDIAVCWSEHDYAHLSTHVSGAIDVAVRTKCDRFIDRVYVHGYLWRSTDGNVWYQVGDQTKTEYLWYVAQANPATGCPGGTTGFYYTSSGYHEIQWGASYDWGNSWSNLVSWIKCGGPY